MHMRAHTHRYIIIVMHACIDRWYLESRYFGAHQLLKFLPRQWSIQPWDGIRRLGVFHFQLPNQPVLTSVKLQEYKHSRFQASKNPVGWSNRPASLEHWQIRDCKFFKHANSESQSHWFQPGFAVQVKLAQTFVVQQNALKSIADFVIAAGDLIPGGRATETRFEKWRSWVISLLARRISSHSRLGKCGKNSYIRDDPSAYIYACSSDSTAGICIDMH